MKPRIKTIQLIFLIVIVAVLGYLLRPTFSSANGRRLLSGKITKVTPACGDQQELLSNGKTVSNPGACTGNSSIILDNAEVIATGQDSYSKFDDGWRPGQNIRAIVNTKQADRYSLECNTCRVWQDR